MWSPSAHLCPFPDSGIPEVLRKGRPRLLGYQHGTPGDVAAATIEFHGEGSLEFGP